MVNLCNRDRLMRRYRIIGMRQTDKAQITGKVIARTQEQGHGELASTYPVEESNTSREFQRLHGLSVLMLSVLTC